MFPTNLILGTKDGQFTAHVMRGPRRHGPTLRVRADRPDAMAAYVKRIAQEPHFGVLLYSSSMDFPEEYGVTREQVAALDKELGYE